MDLLVMENVFYGRSISEKYDLKGSIRNRLVDTSRVEDSQLVLWDENLLKVLQVERCWILFFKKTVFFAVNNHSRVSNKDLYYDCDRT